jgi:hypothetical protein
VPLGPMRAHRPGIYPCTPTDLGCCDPCECKNL